jgi:hypothetical protein
MRLELEATKAQRPQKCDAGPGIDAKGLLSFGLIGHEPIKHCVRDADFEGTSVTIEAMLLRSAKGADARRQTMEEPARLLGGAFDTAPVLREFLKRQSLDNG